MADDSAHHLITASRVNGTPVFDPDGHRIGHIDDLSIDKISGQVLYALLAFGGVFGVMERFHPLPWSLLTYDIDRAGYVIALDKEQIKAATSYTRDELEDFGVGWWPPLS